MAEGKDRPWIAFFSQTGTEIVEIAKHFGFGPDVIVTNERPESLRKINPEIKDLGKIVTLPNKPTLEELEEVIGYYDKPIVTLHGWLRIMPPELCKKYTIFNGHPGLITKYPELKGKDPQVRAFEGNYDTIGCVLHRVTEGVDEGKILMVEEVNAFELELDDIFHILGDRSLYMWINFLEENL